MCFKVKIFETTEQFEDFQRDNNIEIISVQPVDMTKYDTSHKHYGVYLVYKDSDFSFDKKDLTRQPRNSILEEQWQRPKKVYHNTLKFLTAFMK